MSDNSDGGDDGDPLLPSPKQPTSRESDTVEGLRVEPRPLPDSTSRDRCRCRSSCGRLSPSCWGSGEEVLEGSDPEREPKVGPASVRCWSSAANRPPGPALRPGTCVVASLTSSCRSSGCLWTTCWLASRRSLVETLRVSFLGVWRGWAAHKIII